MEVSSTQDLTVSKVLREAFSYISRTLFYQLLMSVLYFSVMFLAVYFVGARLGIFEQYLKVVEQMKMGSEAYSKALRAMMQTRNFQIFYWSVAGTQIFLYPLNFGLLKMYRKLDLGEKPDVHDLFAGYLGSKFFLYASFFLFWLMIYNFLVSTIVGGIIWVLATLFCAPLLFFMNKRIFEGISLSVRALRRFPVAIVSCASVAVLARYAGMISVALSLFTFPVWTAIVYALYQNIFMEPKK